MLIVDWRLLFFVYDCLFVVGGCLGMILSFDFGMPRCGSALCFASIAVGLLVCDVCVGRCVCVCLCG